MTEASDLKAAMRDLTASLNELRKELVRKDVYESNERARDRQLTVYVEDFRELKADVLADKVKRDAAIERVAELRRADRRLLLFSLVVPLLLVIAQVYSAAQTGH